ncbi:hypothetical protein H2198_007644 [Neophaeococcomyces mojaviensis]|uniref:Uncharacterized protein n=1 Tax=Neophaeococcomyces mojaviensis TaxID=3383035 RepID=A0ACC2ZZV7_9EURO|nr:hypothetical protein H2198_007644 [Knufia sp. JES_112]
MAFLPSGPLTLKGGCFCSAIRYEICIPALSERPLVPGALPTSIPPASSITYQPAPSSDAAAEATTTVPNRLPTIEYDHCHSCRRACGSLLQVWIIFELKWVTFKLVPRDEKLGSVGHINSREQQDKMVRYETQDIVKPSKELQAETYIGLYSSDGEAQRTFCTRCGTPVAYHFSGDRGPDWNLGPLIDIAMGTLGKAVDMIQIPQITDAYQIKRASTWKVYDLISMGGGMTARVG